MGGGPDPKPEHLLIILPVPEPSQIIERIEKKHPNIKITFKNLSLTDTPWKGIEDIPRGRSSTLQLLINTVHNGRC